MTDQTAFASCITFCGLTCFSALEPWFNMKRYGCDCCSCGGQRGFCGSCFDRGFNEDSWDRHDAERANAERPPDQETATADPKEQPQTDTEKVTTEQPEPMAEMKLASPA